MSNDIAPAGSRILSSEHVMSVVKPFRTKCIATRIPISIGFDDVAVRAWRNVFYDDVEQIDFEIEEPSGDAGGILRFPKKTFEKDESANRISYITKVMTEAAFVKLGARNGAFDFLLVTIEDGTNAIRDVIGFYDCLITELNYEFLRFSGKAMRSGEGDRYLAEHYLTACRVESAQTTLTDLW